MPRLTTNHNSSLQEVVIRESSRPTQPVAVYSSFAVDFDNLRREAALLYLSNPIAHRLNELMRDYTVGPGVSFSSEDKEVDSLLKSFWSQQRIREIALNLSVYGESVYIASSSDNFPLILQYVSPLEISQVVYDKYDISTPSKVILSFSWDVRELDVIRPGKQGRIFYTNTNTLPGVSLRGTPDILPVIQVVKMFNDFLARESRRIEEMSRWFWDITIKQATQATIDQYAQSLLKNPIPSGAYRVHSDAVEWKVLSPQIPPAVSDYADLLLGYIASGLGIPPHWTGLRSASGTGLESSHEPAYRMLEERQQIIKAFLETISRFYLSLLGHEDAEFTITMPRISMRDFQRSSGALARLAQALDSVVKSGILTREEARSIFLKFASEEL